MTVTLSDDEEYEDAREALDELLHDFDEASDDGDTESADELVDEIEDLSKAIDEYELAHPDILDRPEAS